MYGATFLSNVMYLHFLYNVYIIYVSLIHRKLALCNCIFHQEFYMQICFTKDSKELYLLKHFLVSSIFMLGVFLFTSVTYTMVATLQAEEIRINQKPMASL